MKKIKNGKYLGEGKGMYGPIKVEVDIKASQIKAVEIIEHSDTQGIADAGVTQLPEAIVEAQAYDVDVISGASVTSEGIKEAVKDALQQAGAQAEDFSANSGDAEVEDGTYSSTVDGHNGPLTTEVSFEAGKITDIQVTDHVETGVFGEGAFRTLKPLIIDNQSLDVDLVSGATVSSAAYISAVTDIIKQAGGNPEQFKNKAIQKEVPTETELQVDVLVAGTGAGGMSAAVEAIERGLQVVVLEKRGVLGGTTARSEGKFQAAETVYQKEMGFEDDKQDMYEGLMYLHGDTEGINSDMVRKTAYESSEHLAWLAERGVKVLDNPQAAHTKYPRNKPRLHMVKDDGSGMIQALADTFVAKGGEIYVDTRVTELINEAGSITGAKAETKNGDKITVHADAVILATGGYSNNPALLKELNPNVVDPVVTATGEGDGWYLAKDNGADMIVRKDAMHHFMYLLPNQVTHSTLVGFYSPDLLYVNPEGERFADEESYTFDRMTSLLENDHTYMYAIVGDDFYDEHPEDIDDGKVYGKAFEGNTVEELAENMGVTPQVLSETVERYNELCDKGVDEDFGKESEYMKKVEGPKYYALRFIPNLCDTYNGPRININNQVLDTKGEPISGFYACGTVAGTQLHSQRYFGSGNAILNAVTGGRAAVAHFDENKPADDKRTAEVQLKR